MTKIRKSRRGFTLLEIVIVVAIIVIVAGAAFLGVTVTLTRANNARNQLIENKGDNFEVNARNEIEHLKADPNFTPIQEYTPEGETDEDDEDDDDEDEEENGGGPVDNQPGNKNSPTPTPTPTPTNTPTPTPKPTNTPTPTQSSGESVTIPASSYSYSTHTYSWGHPVQWVDFSFGDATYDGKKVTITVTYSGEVTHNQVSNCKLVSVSGNTAVYTIENYSHNTTNYAGVVNGDAAVTNVEFTAE